MANSKHEIDMCEGSLFPKIVRFAIPVMLSGILQLAFTAADLVVVGRFCGDNSLAAVGSNNALVSLVINILLGMGTGTSVLVSKFFGAKDEHALRNTVNTTVIIAVIGGIIFAIFGILLAEPLLTLMGTPDEVLSLAAIYLRIYFAGLPVIVLYNFTSAILKAVGDSKRPLYYLTIAGVLNVGMNIFFVTVFNMDVAGVALATILSQCVSTFLCLRALVKSNGIYRLDLRNIRFSFVSFKQILRIGLPAGIQGSLFSVSNVLIQSSINSFGAIAMAGNSAAASIESFVFTSLDALNQAAIASVSQNMGGRQYERTKKAFHCCLLLELGIGLSFGWLLILFCRPLLGIYTTDPEAIQVGVERTCIMASTFFINGIQHMMAGIMRGHGYSMLPTIVTFSGICGFRIFWIYVIFPLNRTLNMLFIGYPISWIITAITMLILYFSLRKRAWAANELKLNAREAQ